jgi:PA domain
VFDISNRLYPQLVGSVDLPCGSHTASAIPDLANDRLVIYNSSSSDTGPCRGVEIVEVPLSNPAGAAFLRFESSGDPVTGGGLTNFVTIDDPSPAAGLYGAAGAASPRLEMAVSGSVVLVNDGAGVSPTDPCEPLVGFPAGAIALLDRGTCTFVVKVANAQAAGASAVIVADNAPRPCHDTGIILGKVNKAVCAGHDGFTVWSMNAADGGSFEDPQYGQMIDADVTIGHSGIFSPDGKVIVFGHEPGGGTQPRCTATGTALPGGVVQTDDMKSYFFFDTESGDELGRFVLPRDQAVSENLHDPQLQHGSVAAEAGEAELHPRGGQLPGGDLRSATPRTRRRSPTPARRRSCPSSTAVTGRRTGTTGSSTSPTSPAGSRSGASTTGRSQARGTRTSRTRRRRPSRSTSSGSVGSTEGGRREAVAPFLRAQLHQTVHTCPSQAASREGTSKGLRVVRPGR